MNKVCAKNDKHMQSEIKQAEIKWFKFFIIGPIMLILEVENSAFNKLCLSAWSING